MRCPFLREEQVKSCQAAPFRVSLARSAVRGEGERCTSPDHGGCPVARDSREAHPALSRCPFLQESLVQFCAASSHPTYVPWSESPELRCGHDGHRFCELFLDAGGASARGPARPSADSEEAETPVVGGVPVPGWLFYADNHMWLDPGDDGLCHVGVDAFLTRIVGSVERIAFLTLKGDVHPAVVLTVRGVDLTLAFPCSLPLVAVNTRLRSGPDRLMADPYGLGWLFAARAVEVPAGRGARAIALAAGLRHGRVAREWMTAEIRRATALARGRVQSGSLPADGGRPARDVLGHLEREHVLRLLADLVPLPGDAGRARSPAAARQGPSPTVGSRTA